MNGWIDLDTLIATTGIRRATWDTWARRYSWQAARPNGRIHYHYRQVGPRVRAWEARKAA